LHACLKMVDIKLHVGRWDAGKYPVYLSEGLACY
jgi:hypothetical protein